MYYISQEFQLLKYVRQKSDSMFTNVNKLMFSSDFFHGLVNPFLLEANIEEDFKKYIQKCMVKIFSSTQQSLCQLGEKHSAQGRFSIFK